MLNQLILMGRITKDPELRKLNDGKSVTSATVACDEPAKKDSADKQTLFLTCNFFGNTAETLCKYVHKGDLIAVTGRLRQRKYTNRDGVEVTTYELAVDRLELLPKGTKTPLEPTREQAERRTAPIEEPIASNGADELLNESMDELPF